MVLKKLISIFHDFNLKPVRQSQIVQSVMQDCQYILSHLLPVRNFLVQGPKITTRHSKIISQAVAMTEF